MGFDLFGLAPKNAKGEYFRNNVWWWRGLQRMMEETCADILTYEEMENLGWNNGFEYSEEKARMIVERLREVVEDDEMFDSLGKSIMDDLGDSYKDCWDRKNVLDFIDFIESSGGFRVS